MHYFYVYPDRFLDIYITIVDIGKDINCMNCRGVTVLVQL